MKKFVLLFCVFLCVADFAAAQTKAELQQMYTAYLQEQGYLPSVNSSGNINFKVEGGTYTITVHEDDLEYFRIIFPNFWEIKSEEERAKASAVIMDVNRTTKIAKVYIESWDDTYIDASVLLNTPEDFKRYFRRMLNIIQTARRKFINGMSE